MARELPPRRGKEEAATLADARIDERAGNRRIQQCDEQNRGDRRKPERGGPHRERRHQAKPGGHETNAGGDCPRDHPDERHAGPLRLERDELEKIGRSGASRA